MSIEATLCEVRDWARSVGLNTTARNLNMLVDAVRFTPKPWTEEQEAALLRAAMVVYSSHDPRKDIRPRLAVILHEAGFESFPYVPGLVGEA